MTGQDSTASRPVVPPGVVSKSWMPKRYGFASETVTGWSMPGVREGDW